jgi:hypothetical protein
MRNLNRGSALGRIVAGFVMGGLTLALILLTAGLGPIGAAAFAHPMMKLTLPAAAIATVVIAGLSSSVRRAWGRLCLMNGFASLVLAGVSVENGQPLWPADPAYERALDQAMQWWVGQVIWTTAAYFAAALIIAAALFSLSYWLLHSWQREHRQAQ